MGFLYICFHSPSGLLLPWRGDPFPSEAPSVCLPMDCFSWFSVLILASTLPDLAVQLLIHLLIQEFVNLSKNHAQKYVYDYKRRQPLEGKKDA